MPDVDSVQEDELNEPAACPSSQDTELVGVVGELEVSATVAVNVTDPPAGAVAGFGVTVKVVVAIVFTVRFDVPELVWCTLSPL